MLLRVGSSLPTLASISSASLLWMNSVSFQAASLFAPVGTTSAHAPTVLTGAGFEGSSAKLGIAAVSIRPLMASFWLHVAQLAECVNS